ncbi:MAG TPA: gluconokinase [Albidovulum sp.]|uniref:gluconokinase n=1 Tax=Albidovulum sp. TaxID=1872424 RepID=UPI002B6333F5|nr:gluconokinase [Albidovulum sp.]
MKRAVVVMGVSGAGKSTVGRVFANRIGAPFIEGDDLHPEANRRKMAGGVPLTDADRLPWLKAVAAAIRATQAPEVVVACSALRRSYRDLIRAEAVCPVIFLLLTGEAAVLGQRLRARQGHFMPATLLDSQLAQLEPPGPDEAHLTIDIGTPVEEVVERMTALLP